MSKSSINTFIQALSTALADNTFVRLTLAGYKGSDKSLKRIIIARITIKGEDHLSFTYRHQTRDITKNLKSSNAIDLITQCLQNDFTAATLFTTQFDYTYPHLKKSQSLHKIAPIPTHDRPKNHAVSKATPYLQALGLASSNGQIHAKSQDKFRQINKFIEIITPLIDGIQNPSVIDMGAGKGYLTFALYDHLQQQNKNPKVRAIEYRPDLVTLCNDIAFTCNYDNLHFEQGTIEQANMQDANVLIALHACDTATDDALAKAIQAKCDLIVVAPCCHKQIRRDMPNLGKNHPLSAQLQHGIFMERECEMLTDTMRALLLESAGYKTKIFEFISDAHTAKNIMITATRTDKPDQTAYARFTALKEHFNIPKHHLDELLKP